MRRTSKDNLAFVERFRLVKGIKAIALNTSLSWAPKSTMETRLYPGMRPLSRGSVIALHKVVAVRQS